MFRDKREKLPNTIDERPVSDMQKKYAKSIGLMLPEGITRSDAKALIDRELDCDEGASESLKAYARSKEIVCSDYVGNKYLHELLFDHLKCEDKIAFFCFCVYKSQFGPLENENLEQHEKHALFSEFGKKKVSDSYFIEALDDYTGDKLVLFGKVTKELSNGKMKTIYGASTLTRTYKEAETYLRQQLG